MAIETLSLSIICL